RDYEKRDYYALHLDPSTSPAELAAHLGLQHDGQLASLEDHHVFSAPKHNHDIIEGAITELKLRRRKREVVEERHVLDGVLYNQKQVQRKRLVKRAPPTQAFPKRLSRPGPPVSEAQQEQQSIMKSLGIVDPIFTNQWHLFNTEQYGHDLNITNVWTQGITGKNSTVCIVDDGLDMDSEDLKGNYFAKGSWDFNDKVSQPKPRLADDRHGTRCAGEVAAMKNDVCGVGVAWDAGISGVRILSAPINDIDEAEAVNYGYEENDIYSCSWGPPDDGKTMEAPGVLIRKAMISAVQKGRQGKGTIYVFAAGNGAPHGDNCNFDGYTNSIYSVTVGAIDRNDHHPWYSEQCSALMVVTYSSGSATSAITTTDVGINTCTDTHGGTSAAGPLASGVYALLLEVNPRLGWRDIQWLTAMSSVPPTAEEGNWQTGALGRKYSHMFGYGKLDAYRIVENAKTWEPVKPQAWFYSPWLHVRRDIPQGNQGLVSIFTVTEDMLKNANLERLEHVTVTMNVQHTLRGDLSVELRSPSGMVSHLSVTRPQDKFTGGYDDWTFMSVAHWGESGIGNWTVIVKDTVVNEHSGVFTDWKLRLWGESIDAAKQELLPMPDGHEDDDHDVDAPHHVTTTSIEVPTQTSVSDNPSDKPNRPSHPGRPSSASTTDAAATPTTSPQPSITAPAESTTPTPTAQPDDSFLPSIFPTFGVSKRTQIWIYAAIGLILLFCISLAAYLYLARRRRLAREPRDAYEFEMLDDRDLDGGEGEVRAKRGRRGGPRRAGELYDAFAGESDEDFFSGDEDE
ncbi:hypothetical protein NA57DRAFT_9805, partial [Rhizodiscina lignyota]